jgi:conjugal transfer pilus assembly protein TraE
MKLQQLSDDIAFRTGIKRAFQLFLAGSLLTNLLLAVALTMADRTHRETMVPPEIKKGFWVEDSRVSGDYLEQMGLFLVQLALNNTPISAEYNARTLLKYVGPASYGEIEKLLLGNAKRLKEDNASTVFAPSQITASEKENAVAFSGVFSTYISDKRVSQVQKDLLVRFGYSGGKVYILEMRETDPKQPFKDQDKKAS